MNTIPHGLQRLFAVVALAPTDPDAPLALASLQVIQLVDAIEMAFDVFVDADDVTRANFATPRALGGLLARLGVELG